MALLADVATEAGHPAPPTIESFTISNAESAKHVGPLAVMFMTAPPAVSRSRDQTQTREKAAASAAASADRLENLGFDGTQASVWLLG